MLEPVAKGPALAFALFAEVLHRRDPEAIIFSMASDHAIAEKDVFQGVLRQAHTYVTAHPEHIALMGVKPTRPDTGLGYIKVDTEIQRLKAYSVEKFVEKPSYPVAKRYAQSKEFFWNVAYYCFAAKTLLEAYTEASAESVTGVRQYLDTNDAAYFEAAPKMVHEIEVIKFLKSSRSSSCQQNSLGMILATGAPCMTFWLTLTAMPAVLLRTRHIISMSTVRGVWSDSENPTKLIATVGLKDIIVVDTADSLLVMHKGHSQDIKTVIEEIKQRGLDKYL